MSRQDVWHRAQNVLCVRLDTIGDVLMTTPAIRAVKSGRPDRRVTLLTSQPGAAVASLVPEVDDVVVYDAPWMKATAQRANSLPEYAMVEHLRACGFDAAIIFTVYSQNPLPSAFLSYMADIPLRLAHCRENPYQLLTDWVRESEPEQQMRHEVQRQLDLVASVGYRTEELGLSLQVPVHARERVMRLTAELGLNGGAAWAVVHPGATAASRRYPPEHFAEVLRRLNTDYGITVVLTGSGNEVELVEQIRAAAAVPAHSLAGRLDLPELAALIQEATLLIANNTGPVHIAAAVGTPVVDIYALTNPQHAPWYVPHRLLYHDVPCRFCYKSTCPLGHHDCLRLIEPGRVVEAALELLRETGVKTPGPVPLPILGAEGRP